MRRSADSSSTPFVPRCRKSTSRPCYRYVNRLFRGVNVFITGAERALRSHATGEEEGRRINMGVFVVVCILSNTP